MRVQWTRFLWAEPSSCRNVRSNAWTLDVWKQKPQRCFNGSGRLNMQCECSLRVVRCKIKPKSNFFLFCANWPKSVGLPWFESTPEASTRIIVTWETLPVTNPLKLGNFHFMGALNFCRQTKETEQKNWKQYFSLKSVPFSASKHPAFSRVLCVCNNQHKRL